MCNVAKKVNSIVGGPLICPILMTGNQDADKSCRFFYPFNLGRNVCLADLAVTSEAACPTAPQIFGNHVGIPSYSHISSEGSFRSNRMR